jgi:hypothetical protein
MKKIIVLLVIAAGISAAFVQQSTQLLIPGKGIEGYVTVGASTSSEIKTKFGTAYKEVNHYTELGGSKTVFSVERQYARQGISFYFRPESDTVFCVKVKAPYKAKTDKGITLGVSTMQEVRSTYGPADFYADGPDMFLEYAGIKFYTASGASEADVLKQKVSKIAITEFGE